MSKRHINACTPDCDPDCGILFPHGYRPATAEERERRRLRKSPTDAERKLVAFLRDIIKTADTWVPMHHGSAEGAAHDEGQQSATDSLAEDAMELLRALGVPADGYEEGV